MMGWGYGMGAGMWVGWLVLVIVIALVVFLVIRTSGAEATDRRGPAPRPTGRPTPSEILAERYARGEISTAEYEERLSHLSS